VSDPCDEDARTVWDCRGLLSTTFALGFLAAFAYLAYIQFQPYYDDASVGVRLVLLVIAEAVLAAAILCALISLRAWLGSDGWPQRHLERWKRKAVFTALLCVIVTVLSGAVLVMLS